MKIKITAIVENTGFRHNLLAQHGQSLLIEYDEALVLFDVGEIYEGLHSNLERMQINPKDLTCIVISHRHIDHIGSLPKLLKELDYQELYLPTQLGDPDLRKYSEKYEFFRGDELGYNLALSKKEAYEVSNYQKAEVVTEPTQLFSGFYITGPLGGEMQEQAIIMDLKEKGIVVVVGCSHPTLEVIVNKAKEIAGNNKVYGLVGGFHFKDMEDEERVEAVAKVKALNPEFIIPSHCTGAKAIQLMIEEMGDIVHVAGNGSFGTGNSIEIEPELKFNLV
jgi:7,8-dihydropterin-6-yl-methyl-4-(beta-D-ribofuranosyl)aminobenzene 5'-phosphate synthase